MGFLPAQRPRPDRGFERMYRRHVGDVYRYALALTGGPEAEDVTGETFAIARRVLDHEQRPPTHPRPWLIDLAYHACRDRETATHAPSDPPSEEESQERLDPLSTCVQAQFAVSRHLDGRLSRAERRPMKAHLAECPWCKTFARRQRVHRDAIRSLARLVVPASLAGSR